MRKHFAISISIFVVGFMVLGVAIVYRLNRASGEAAPAVPVRPYAAQLLRLPVGAQAVSSSAADGLVTVTYRQGAAMQMRIFDGQTGEMIQQIDIVGEGQ